MKLDSVFTTCDRCDGQCRIDAYSHVDHGTCFKCGGSGKLYNGQAAIDLQRQHNYFRQEFYSRAEKFAKTQILEIDEWIMGAGDDMMVLMMQIKEVAETEYAHLNPNKEELDPNFDFFALLDS